ncbi:MAG TPA: hypothetical protein PKM88_09875 [bacterium]|nr:hypothetical protein [bacterium]
MAEQAWTVWAQDMFDREAPRQQAACGRGLAQGLAALWRAHLDEGVQDDGRLTLTRFYLDVGGGQLQIPDHRDGARALRGWLRAGDEMLTAQQLARLSLANDDPDDGLRAILDTAVRVPEPRALRRALLPADELVAEARQLLNAAAQRQQRLQWLGVAAYGVLVVAGAVAVATIDGVRTGAAAVLYGSMVVLIMLMVGTLVETMLRRRRQLAVLAALGRPERIVRLRHKVRTIKSYHYHELSITLDDGEIAVFTMPKGNAAIVMRELRDHCPALRSPA